MRVLITSVSRFTEPTGICRYASLLASALSQYASCEVTIAVGPWQHAYFQDVLTPHKDVTILPVPIRNSQISRNLWSLFGLPRLARKLRAEVVHLAYPVPVYRSFFHSALLMTVHDLYTFDSPKNFQFPAANRFILTHSVRQCDRLICISANTRRRFLALFPGTDRDIVKVIHNPVKTSDAVSGRDDSVVGLSSGNFLLSVAQHRSNKNLALLIHAHAALRRAGRFAEDHVLVLVGSNGPETPKLLKEVDELQIAANVRFLSSISDATLAWLYRNCVALVVCSSEEGFCLPLAEALTQGSPVVCSDIPVLHEVGSDLCSYFPLEPTPLEALMLALEHLPDRLSGSQITSARVRFSPDTVAASYRAAYQQVLDNLGSGARKSGVTP